MAFRVPRLLERLPNARLPRPLRRGTTSAPLVDGALPVLGHGVAFGKDPNSFFDGAQRAHGDVLRVVFPQGEQTFLLNGLDLDGYYKNADLDFEEIGVEMGGRAFGYSYAAAAHAGIDEISHQIHHYMKGAPLHVATERMQACFERLLLERTTKTWQRRELLSWASEFVFEASTEALFGDGTYSEVVYEAYRTIDDHFGLLAMGLPARLVRGARAAQRDLGEGLRRLGPGHAELLRHRRTLFRDRACDDDVWPRFDSGLLWAAQANTVAAAFWTVFHVLRDERARAEVLDEVRGVRPAPRKPGDAPFTAAELRSMVKLTSAIHEVNRLTTAPMSPRRALRDTRLALHGGGTLEIDEGADLALFPPAIHLDPEIYESPLEFRFDRFLPGEDGRARRFFKDGTRVRFNLVPFGAGSSMCPGRFFAINEFKIVVACLLTWFDFELLDPRVPDLDTSRVGFGTLAPTRDVPFRYRRRV